LICVPTPLDIDQKPDLSALTEATTVVGQYLKRGALVIIESTIEPGTCRDIILPILVGASGLQVHEFQLAYSPERIDPANKVWRIKNTPKLVAGIDDFATHKATQFYSKFIDYVVSCSSIEIAETAKLLENSFRLINISLINEIAMFCNEMKIDINEVISAAASKPYGFMPFYPGIGAGGHCIPVDPMYLSNKARRIGASTKLIDLAQQINREMPIYFANRVERQLGEISGKKILIVGISYKPNISDIRESSVLRLILELTKRGANVSWHDDLVREWNGQTSVPLSEDFDLAIIATPHDYLNLTKLKNIPVLNTKGSI
jgi:UDP-N-acetyl-D-glucosamine dehydrogenase